MKKHHQRWLALAWPALCLYGTALAQPYEHRFAKTLMENPGLPTRFMPVR